MTHHNLTFDPKIAWLICRPQSVSVLWSCFWEVDIHYEKKISIKSLIGKLTNPFVMVTDWSQRLWLVDVVGSKNYIYSHRAVCKVLLLIKILRIKATNSSFLTETSFSRAWLEVVYDLMIELCQFASCPLNICFQFHLYLYHDIFGIFVIQ